mmetsp:Transcript_7377/g.18024  ORF Transcript_7377/g.18024 Transcript_7377/m.18024 type:complete len:202 (+) Transcript_7377:784-1389(+)
MLADEEDASEETIAAAAAAAADIGTIDIEMTVEEMEVVVVVVDTVGEIEVVLWTIVAIAEAAIAIITTVGEEATDTTTIADGETTFAVETDHPIGEAPPAGVESIDVAVVHEADHCRVVEITAEMTEEAAEATREAHREGVTTIATGVATTIIEVVDATTTIHAVVLQRCIVGTIAEEMIAGIVGRYLFCEHIRCVVDGRN